MQTVYLKEHEGAVLNSVGQSAPWLSAFGSLSVNGESCGQLKPFSFEISDQLAAGKELVRGVEQLLDKGHATQFTIFPDDCKMSGDEQNPSATLSLQSPLSEPHHHFEIGFSHPMICAKYPYMDQFYGLFSSYGPQIAGRVMLPINMTSEDGPTYVNAKQYRGILRRRQSRAKAVLENKFVKRRKPYIHESRHLHAMRRPRGCGGRFLNTRNSTTGNGKTVSKVNETSLQSSASQSSEVLQSEVGTLTSLKGTKESSPNISGLEVTSMYSRGGFDSFTVNHLGPAVHSLADMIDSGRGIITPTKWVAAVSPNCCNL
ncbi:hypothetical protein RJT34_23785 [Clitoria ternatea]|uniref:Nuclear transcription factor Y subunit n=1 Tax=Clitoria ternatea TaxID=43366 RepID=A0AAN9FN98_CLITE